MVELVEQPVIVDDAQSDPRVYADVIRRLGVRCYMTVPLISVSQPLGVIAVADERAGTLGPDDERVLALLASGAVIGLVVSIGIFVLLDILAERKEERAQAARRSRTIDDIFARSPRNTWRSISSRTLNSCFQVGA